MAKDFPSWGNTEFPFLQVRPFLANCTAWPDYHSVSDPEIILEYYLSLLLLHFFYLFLSNKTLQNLVPESNKDLWFLMTLWVGWQFLCWFLLNSLVKLLSAESSVTMFPTLADNTGYWLECPGSPRPLIFTSATLASWHGHLWEHSIGQKQKLQAQKSHNIISTTCFIFLHGT